MKLMKELLKESSASGLSLSGWKIVDKSFTTKGSDPTFTQVYVLTKNGKEIKITEFFGDWSVDINFGMMSATIGLKMKDANALLKKLGAPSLEDITDLIEKENDYSDDPMGHPSSYM